MRFWIDFARIDLLHEKNRFFKSILHSLIFRRIDSVRPKLIPPPPTFLSWTFLGPCFLYTEKHSFCRTEKKWSLGAKVLRLHTYFNYIFLYKHSLRKLYTDRSAIGKRWAFAESVYWRTWRRASVLKHYWLLWMMRMRIYQFSLFAYTTWLKMS